MPATNKKTLSKLRFKSLKLTSQIGLGGVAKDTNLGHVRGVDDGKKYFKVRIPIQKPPKLSIQKAIVRFV